VRHLKANYPTANVKVYLSKYRLQVQPWFDHFRLGFRLSLARLWLLY
jgi:hypothetical protein